MKEAITKNEIENVLHEYIGRRKAAQVGKAVWTAMQKETKHTHQGEIFFANEDENGEIVLTRESKAKDSVKAILQKNLENDTDVKECFENLYISIPEVKSTRENVEQHHYKQERNLESNKGRKK